MKTKTERIDKILSNNGFGSRRDVKRLLHSGAVCVNGAVCTAATAHADTASDLITIDGKPLELKKTAWFMLNKPSGVLSATKDRDGNTTVIDILDESLTLGYKEGELFPVGRLDIDTEGLILVTSDGEAAHRLTSPKTGVTKTYLARLETALTASEQAEYLRRFTEGIHITADRGEKAHDCKSAQLEFIPRPDGLANEAFLTISEGKYHQIKRMFFALGNRVIYLKRTATGALKLDESLECGQARKLSEEEIQLLFT